MKKYTPGPWATRISDSGIYITTVGAIFRNQNGIDIPIEVQRANARLVEHAPEMVELLEEILTSDAPVSNDRISNLIKRSTGKEVEGG